MWWPVSHSSLLGPDRLMLAARTGMTRRSRTHRPTGPGALASPARLPLATTASTRRRRSRS